MGNSRSIFPLVIDMDKTGPIMAYMAYPSMEGDEEYYDEQGNKHEAGGGSIMVRSGGELSALDTKSRAIMICPFMPESAHKELMEKHSKVCEIMNEVMSAKYTQFEFESPDEQNVIVKEGEKMLALELTPDYIVSSMCDNGLEISATITSKAAVLKKGLIVRCSEIPNDVKGYVFKEHFTSGKVVIEDGHLVCREGSEEQGKIPESSRRLVWIGSGFTPEFSFQRFATS